MAATHDEPNKGTDDNNSKKTNNKKKTTKARKTKKQVKTTSHDWRPSELKTEMIDWMLCYTEDKIDKDGKNETKYPFRDQTDYLMIRIPVVIPTPYYQLDKSLMPKKLQDKYDECKKNTDKQTFNNDILDAVGEVFERQNADYYNRSVKPFLQVKIVWPTDETRPSDFKEDIFTNIKADNEDGNKTKGGKREKKEKGISYFELDNYVKDELEQFDHMPYNYEPKAGFYVSETNLKQIVKAYVGHAVERINEEDVKTWLHIQKLRIYAPLINAVPIKVKKYSNKVNIESRYQIIFETNTNRTITTETNTIEGIIGELHDKALLASQPREAEIALAQIVNCREQKGKVELTNEVEQAGFYLSEDNKIECYGVEFKKPDIPAIKECCKFINEYIGKFEKKDENGKIIKDRRVIPVHVLKWSICSPFNWVMKQYHKWLHWQHFGGWYSTAKNTMGIWGLSLWRLQDKQGHVISFDSANTEYRLGQAVSQSTFPILINEAEMLADREYKKLVAHIKNGVDEKNFRGAMRNKRYQLTPSMSAVMFTGNGQPPTDLGYRSKVPSVIFTHEDFIDRNSKEAIEFNNWSNSKLYLMGTLGDFTANCIMGKPEIIKNKGWNGIAIEVLSEFYASAGLDIPEWINLTLDTNEAIQTHDEVVELLRGYFLTKINDTCNRYRPPAMKTDDGHELGEMIDPNPNH